MAFALAVVAVDAGIGRHKSALSPKAFQRAVKYELLTRVSLTLSQMFVRLSVALLMLRFSSPKRWFEVSVDCLIVLIVVSHIPAVVLAIERCNPVRKDWSSHVPGDCHSQYVARAVWYYNCG